MAKEIASTHSDLTSIGGGNTINIESIDPSNPTTYKSIIINYSDLSAAEKTQLNDCMTMLESKIV